MYAVESVTSAGPDKWAVVISCPGERPIEFTEWNPKATRQDIINYAQVKCDGYNEELESDMRLLNQLKGRQVEKKMKRGSPTKRYRDKLVLVPKRVRG